MTPRGGGGHWKSAARHASGDASERELQGTHNWYALKRRLTITHLAFPVAGAPGSMWPSGKAACDYIGCRAPDGRTIAFDLKGVTGVPSYTHEVEQLHQLRFLLDVRDRGGLSFLLLYDKQLPRMWILTDLLALLAGRAIPIRSIERATSRADRQIIDHLPAVPPSSVYDVARGAAAPWDYLATLATL